VDIPARLGTPVVAVKAGVVSFSDAHGNYGNMVVLDHGNGLQSVYAHLAKRAAEAGQAVRQGQVIGAVGKSGNATGPHLHFEVRRGGRCVDPKPYLPAPEK
jgi:murein DD-endopeptidase MepM/ murein hydrolase activator NlpD